MALDGFRIDRTEVTSRQYRLCMQAGVCDPPEQNDFFADGSYYDNNAYDDYPVVLVSWHQAATYCEWTGGRLPTEAEWEYAARGPEGRVFPWGNEFDGTRLNYCDTNCEAWCAWWKDDAYDDGHASVAPVGSYATGASWCGAYDLAGNVWEWVGDWYEGYSSERQRNPVGPSSGENRVIRGGSWCDCWFYSRGATRGSFGADSQDVRFGFRCAVPGEE